MIKKQKIQQLPNAIFRELGWDYFISEEAENYLTKELIVISDKEAENFADTGNRLYDKFVQTAEYILDNNLMDSLAIPKNLQKAIRLTWEDDRNLHLFGRFDFAGGLNGQPIKMLEFNADTPTSLPETALIQWAQLKANGIEETKQFNFVYEALVENFKLLKHLNNDLEPTILFSTMRDAPEDDNNVAFLMQAADEAGLDAYFRYVDEVTFSAENGVWFVNKMGDDDRCNFWFKLVPWEYIANEEPELMDILTQIIEKRAAIILNPAYTMLFQSKGILKYLWDKFPNDDAILECSFQEPIGRFNYPFVQKVLFGREGQNIAIYDKDGLPETSNQGDYEQYPSIYQAYTPLLKDEENYYYQAGVFFAYEACGIGFRRQKNKIMNNAAQFVGHKID